MSVTTGAPSQKPFDPVWWTKCWWEDTEYQREYGLSLERIRETVKPLKTFFDEEWTQAAFDARKQNPVLTILYGGTGLWPFEDLIWLGKIVGATASAPGFKRAFQGLIGDKSWATIFEMEVASWFAEKGWSVDFLKADSKGKMPDLRVCRADVSAPIECKKLEAEQWEQWAEELSFDLMCSVSRIGRVGAPSFDVIFEPRLSDLLWNHEASKEEIRKDIIERICAAVREATYSEPPRSVVIPGIAEIQMRPDIPGSGLHGMGGIEISPQAKMRRIIQNGVREAALQLAAQGPGAIVIKSDHVPPKELVDVALGSLYRGDQSLLASVAIVAIAKSAGSRPVIWRNPSLVDHRASAMLVQAFEEILFGKDADGAQQ
jgi:hypothetical protein